MPVLHAAIRDGCEPSDAVRDALATVADEPETFRDLPGDVEIRKRRADARAVFAPDVAGDHGTAEERIGIVAVAARRSEHQRFAAAHSSPALRH